MRVTGWVMAMALWAGVTAATAGDAPVTVAEPWIREGPPTAKALAGYMRIRSDAPQRALVGAESAAFQRIMLHQTVMKDGMAAMVHRERIDLPTGVELRFEPAGFHLMLIKPRRPLKAGDQVVIDLLYADGARQTVVFEVRRGS